jgi:hypothetical protein
MEPYDQAGIYGTIGKRHPDADVIVPPRATAVLSDDVVQGYKGAAGSSGWV